MAIIKSNQLQAALQCAAKKGERREGLLGVQFKVNAKGETFLIATDGTIGFVGRITLSESAGGPRSFVIPREAIELALKLKMPELPLMENPFLLGPLGFSPVGSPFPNLDRVVPKTANGKTAQFDPELLVRCRKALSLWTGDSKAHFTLHHNGDGPAVMCADSAFALIMPLRVPGQPFSTFMTEE